MEIVYVVVGSSSGALKFHAYDVMSLSTVPLGSCSILILPIDTAHLVFQRQQGLLGKPCQTDDAFTSSRSDYFCTAPVK